MKNILCVLLLSLALFSCKKEMDFAPTSSLSASHSNSKLSSGVNVKLYKAWTSYNGKYGRYDYTRRFQVEVRNMSFAKKVNIRHKMTDSTWKDFPLNYLVSTSDNTEIWAADITFSNYNNPPSAFFADQFVAWFESNGVQYWDNNNGQNYSMQDLEGTMLRSDFNVAVDTYFSAFNSSGFYVDVDVRNIAYSKQVSVVYTTDGWVTSHTTSLNFVPYFTVGAAQVISSPNKWGMERWLTNISLPSNVTKIEYAVKYKVNGTDYWDNNFGHNFVVFRTN
jgi:hypothetical protein